MHDLASVAFTRKGDFFTNAYECWAEQVDYTVQKAWMALHFIMRFIKRGNKSTKSLAYTSLVRPILEFGAACWDLCRECQISALDRVQNKAAKFANHTGVPVWEPLAQCRRIARMCALQSI
jgi:hypothetical protein